MHVTKTCAELCTENAMTDRVKEQERDGRQKAVNMPTICTIWAGKGINLPEPSLELDHSVAGQSKQPWRTVLSAKGIN